MRPFNQSSFSLTSLSICLAATLWSSTALAQADDAGAARLTAVLQTYLGTTEGDLAISVDGDAYNVVVDLAPLMAGMSAMMPGMTSTVSPLEWQVSDNGDGTWAYSLDQPVSFDYAVPDAMSAKTTYGQVKISGVFDEALGDSSEYSVEMTDIVSEQTQNDPSLGETIMRSTTATAVMTGTAQASATGEGLLDSQFTQTATDVAYEMTLPGEPGMDGMPVSIAMPTGGTTGAMTGYQPQALYGLLAFFVAHPSVELIEADPAGLNTALTAALPVFQNLSVTGTYQDVAVTSPIGPLGVAEIGMTIDMNGAVANGKFRQAVNLKGLSLPEGLLPPSVAPLVPSDVSLDFAVAKFDLASAATLALGLLDLPDPGVPPEGFDAQMLAAFLPTGRADITLSPGSIVGPAYKLTYEASMAAGLAQPMPVGIARISLTGIEQINAAMMASPPEMGMADMAPMLGIAEALAEKGADGELIWQIKMTPTGGVLVNGQDLMGGGQ